VSPIEFVDAFKAYFGRFVLFLSWSLWKTLFNSLISLQLNLDWCTIGVD